MNPRAPLCLLLLTLSAPAWAQSADDAAPRPPPPPAEAPPPPLPEPALRFSVAPAENPLAAEPASLASLVLDRPAGPVEVLALGLFAQCRAVQAEGAAVADALFCLRPQPFLVRFEVLDPQRVLLLRYGCPADNPSCTDPALMTREVHRESASLRIPEPSPPPPAHTVTVFWRLLDRFYPLDPSPIVQSTRLALVLRGAVERTLEFGAQGPCHDERARPPALSRVECTAIGWGGVRATVTWRGGALELTTQQSAPDGPWARPRTLRIPMPPGSHAVDLR